MATKLYVGNLGRETTATDLQQLFSTYGEVRSAEVVMDRAMGTSKGFGFVEMVTDQTALAAINALNGTAVGGKPLMVNKARPREERGGSGNRRGGGGRRY